MASNGIRFTRLEVGDLLLPVGFRFHPTEEELVSHYLKLKLRGMDSLVGDAIREINICNYEPWDLPAISLIKSDDEWYFYNRPIYKKNGRNEIERATDTGFWKITGQDKIVKARDNKTIGKKRILTFRQGRGRNAPVTNWVMHEFYIPQINPNANQRDFVLCHVKKKSGKNTDGATCDEGESSNYNNAPDFENQLQPAHNMHVEEEHNQPPQNVDIFQRHMGSLLADAHSNNNYHGMEENSEEFVNGFFADDPYQDYSEEITHDNVFNDSTMPQSPRKVYLKDCGVSSDSDTEVQHRAAEGSSLQMLSVPQASSSHSRREEGVMLRNQTLRQAASSKPQTDRLQSVSDEDSGTHQITSRLQSASRPINALKLKSASSVDVDAVSLQINSIQLACNEHYNNERTRRRTYPTSALVALGKPNELEQQQSKAKEAAERRAAVDFPPKRNFISESNKDIEESNNTEKGLKQTHNATTAGNWMSCSLISWETSPPLTSPPSVYIFNTVLGAILLFVFARELVLYGQW
ncbi:NAC domain-containing protein 4-like [Pyrus ussuriensis x Pyrus communis]|uniref:NAC domain-containing protein 4-like n=1 Tax=Pyrus ussuriensis x Pyrus communis TaxID=2448454 RepID=A0A5N5EYW7_9ROSA|nr:NAC domain-containing protein 4-like [Pyrus ussuriensis x Pyrus communis]